MSQVMSPGERDVARAVEDGTLLPAPEGGHAAKVLLVFLPGLAVKPTRYVRLLTLLREDFLRNSDLLRFKFDNGYLSKERPADVARRLADAIDGHQRETGYESILIVGHSLGALIARQAVLDGHAAQRGWARRVCLVLLGDSNRGFSPGTAWEKFWAWSLQNFRATSHGDLFLNCLRGSPWVTGLRLAWIRFFAQEGAPEPPRTVQIRGDRDRVVAADDSEDVNRIDGAELFQIRRDDVGRDVGHEDIVEVTDRDDLLYRRLRALIASVLRGGVVGKEKLRASMHGGFDLLIFLVHGIRDFAEWQQALEFKIRHQSVSDKIDIVPVQYGYFTLLQFLMSSQRARAVRVFVDRYVQEVVKSPGAKVVVAAHSNGTYVFGKALMDCDFIRVERAYLAGSVLPRSFPWHRLLGNGKQVGAVRNDCAKLDWPVGGLCAGLQWLYLDVRRLAFTIGTSGYKGFRDDASGLTNNCYLAGGHGAALEPQNRDEVADYLLTGSRASPERDRLDHREAIGMKVLYGIAPLLVAVVFGLLLLVVPWVIAGIFGTGPAIAYATMAYTFVVVLVLMQT